MKLNGEVFENFVSRNRVVKIHGEARARNIREKKDVMEGVLVTDLMPIDKAANEEQGLDAGTTIRVMVRNKNDIRRVTGFNDMIDKLKALKPGSVVQIVGKLMPTAQGGRPGFRAEEVNIIREANDESIKFAHVDFDTHSGQDNNTEQLESMANAYGDSEQGEPQ